MAEQIKPFQSIADVAALTGLSQFSLRKRIREGSLKCVKSGTKYYINVPDLLRQEGLTLADLNQTTQEN